MQDRRYFASIACTFVEAFVSIWLHLIMASFGLIGRIDPFDETTESWENYVERLEQYFEVNEVDNTKKVSSHLTLIGGKHIPY